MSKRNNRDAIRPPINPKLVESLSEPTWLDAVMNLILTGFIVALIVMLVAEIIVAAVTQ